MTLYIKPTCPYCVHVMQTIDVKRVPNLTVVEVPQSHGDRVELKELTGQTYVPTLVDGETIIADDDDGIIAYLQPMVLMPA